MAKLNIADAQLMADNKDVVKACENLLQLCADFHLARLTSLDISNPEAIHDLLVAKARLDGMRALITDFSGRWQAEIRK